MSVSDPSRARIGRNPLSLSAKTDRVRNIETTVQLPIPPIRPGTYAHFSGYDTNVMVCSTASRESGTTEAGRHLLSAVMGGRKCPVGEKSMAGSLPGALRKGLYCIGFLIGMDRSGVLQQSK